MSKFTDPIYENPPDSKTVEGWIAKRRSRDKVDMLDPGFSLRASGRDGHVYYREGDRILELYWEMSGSKDFDILLSLRGLSEWMLPHREPIEITKQNELNAALRGWLTDNNIRALIQK